MTTAGWELAIWTMVLAVAAALLFLAAQIVHLGAVLHWSSRRTEGLNYFGLPQPARLRFRNILQLHFLLLQPLLRLLSGSRGDILRRGSFVFRGIAGPANACSLASFQRAVDYQPLPEDVFVVTQMKCGTTWMQHLVYQILTRGQGDLPGGGIALNAISPWLESRQTVGLNDAPLIGTARPTRLIKTHLPAALCPFNRQAKYIYVVRHPVSCFASCADFVRSNLRGCCPELADLERWFLDDRAMWWGTWPLHVAGWWRRAQDENNVLVVRFEDLKCDLAAAAGRVAEFLELPPLTTDEMADVLKKCSFDYMRRHSDSFEMQAPHLLQQPGGFFVSGKADRFIDLPDEVGQRIGAACRSGLQAEGIPLAELYPELAGG